MPRSRLVTNRVTKSTPTRRIVCLGDSLTLRGDPFVNYPNYLLAYLGPYVEMVNAGVSGDFLAQMIARVNADVVQKRPTDVIFMGGINDNKFGPAPPNSAQIQTDMTTIHTSIKTTPARLIQLTITPWGGPPGGGVWTTQRETDRQNVNTFILANALVDRKVNLDPIVGDFVTDPTRPRLITEYVNTVVNDGLHWNAIGAQVVANAIFQQIYGGIPLQRP